MTGRFGMYVLTATAAILGCGAADNVVGSNVAPVVSASSSPSHSFFASPTGSSIGDGSKDNPWDLATALAQPLAVQPGDTIWLRAGTYRGKFASRITGTAAAPIVVRQAPGEHATIDGELKVDGSYGWYWGFEVMFSDPQRTTSIVGSDPTDLPRYGTGASAQATTGGGSFNKFINLVIHDLSNGTGDPSTVHGTEIYGCLIYNNGWIGPDRGHGHGIYMQNQTDVKQISGNVIFDNFSENVQLYGSDQAFVLNIVLDGNDIFGSGAPVAQQFGWDRNVIFTGAGGNLGNTSFLNNSIYNVDPNSTSAIQLTQAQISTASYPVEFRGNTVQGMAEFSYWQHLTVRDNVFTSGAAGFTGQNRSVVVRVPDGTSLSAYDWNNNTYYDPSLVNTFVLYQQGVGAGFPDLTTWRAATGWDAQGTYSKSLPAAPTVIVLPNKYQAGRAKVTVWNWRGAATASLDASAFLKAGDAYVVHHVFDIYGTPVASGVYSGQRISIPLRAYAPPTPIGMSGTVPGATSEFNVFIVEKQ